MFQTGINPVLRQAVGWKASLEQLRQLRQDYANDAHLMTPYEREKAMKGISEKKQTIENMVVQSAVSEWNSVLTSFQDAQSKLTDAKRRETARWVPGRLADEIRVHQALADVALSSDNPADELRRIYNESIGSGDEYKYRGCCEVFRGLLARSNSSDMQVRMEVNSLAKSAERDLSQLRHTPEVQQAEQAIEQARVSVSQKADELQGVSDALSLAPGTPGNFDIFRALSRAVWEPGSNELVRVRPAGDAFGNWEG